MRVATEIRETADARGNVTSREMIVLPDRLPVTAPGQLQQAARWGLLRRLPPRQRQVVASGAFSLAWDDLRGLLGAAGAEHPELWIRRPARLEGGSFFDYVRGRAEEHLPQVVLLGPGHDEDVEEWAWQAGVEAWDEGDLVHVLTPSLESLRAPQGEPPF